MAITITYLLLGGNEGDRLLWLHTGQHGISKRIGQIIKLSAVYETAAWGKEDEPAFLNQVAAVETELTAHEILEEITHIEQQIAGRIRDRKWAARTLDIDILFYGEDVIAEPGLTIPHAHLQERRFALVPLCELASGLMHPLLHHTCAELLDACTDPLSVNIWGDKNQASGNYLSVFEGH